MAPGRLRRVPALFCSGAGQQTVSQDARAALAVKGKNKSGRKRQSSRDSRPSARKHRKVVESDEEDAEDDEKDEEEEEQENVPTPATQADAFEDDDAHDEALLSCSVDEPAQFPDHLRTGSKAFIEWYIERFKSNAGTFTDEAQTIIMNSVPTNPMDVLCPLSQVHRRRLLLAFLTERKITQKGSQKGEPISAKTSKTYIVDIFNYLKFWQSEDDERQARYGDWDFRHIVWQPLKQLLQYKSKIEDGLTTAAAPLNLDDDPNAAASIMDAMGHHSAEIKPEQVELVRMWLRSYCKWAHENNYEKNTFAPQRGELQTSGFSDYLYFEEMHFAIDVGSNAGQRGVEDYAKLAHNNFAEIVDKTDELGLWNVDAFVKKNTGRGWKRAPHIILDRGVNQGVVARYKLLKSRRNSTWPKGIVGEGLDALPAAGIRMFLQPGQQVKMTSPVYWQKMGIGTNNMQPLKIIIPCIIQELGSKCGIPFGFQPTMSALRSMISDIGPEMGMPHDIGSVITGHVSLAPEKRDKNQRGYQEQLAMDLRNQLKCSFILSDAGREMAEGQERFNWTNDVPEKLVTVIRETLPKRLRQCDLDCRESAADCIRELINGNATAPKTIDMTNGRLDPSPEHSAAKRIQRTPMMQQPNTMMPPPQMQQLQQFQQQQAQLVMMQQQQQQQYQNMIMMQQQQQQQPNMFMPPMMPPPMMPPAMMPPPMMPQPNLQQVMQQQQMLQQQIMMMQQQQQQQQVESPDGDDEPAYLPPTQLEEGDAGWQPLA